MKLIQVIHVSYILYICNKIPAQNNLSGERLHFGPQFQRLQCILVGKACLGLSCGSMQHWLVHIMVIVTECTVPSVNPNVITDHGCRNSGPEPEVATGVKGLPQGPPLLSQAFLTSQRLQQPSK